MEATLLCFNSCNLISTYVLISTIFYCKELKDLNERTSNLKRIVLAFLIDFNDSMRWKLEPGSLTLCCLLCARLHRPFVSLYPIVLSSAATQNKHWIFSASLSSLGGFTGLSWPVVVAFKRVCALNLIDFF